jgi:hypothetical protein
MKSTIRTLLIIASATAAAVALGPASSAAPVETQANTAVDRPGMDHSCMDQAAMANGGHAMPGMQHGGSMDTMQHDGCMEAMQRGGNMDAMQHAGNMDMMQQHRQMMAKMQSMHSGGPTLPGQDAFGAIGEIVAMLEADPATDWSKIDLEALRGHLIDMNEVILNANAATKAIEGGVQIGATGTGRTLAAIQRMVPMHAAEINGQKGWSARTTPLPDGVLLTVTATDPKEVAHIRGLGFAGIMVEGSHHQAHHLAIAKGEPMHAAGAGQAPHAH